MSSLIGTLRRNWHILLGTKKYLLDDVWLLTDINLVPRRVASLIFKHTYEDAERRLVKKVLNENSNVLEIGCGIGLVSLVARKTASKGNVRSYEANPNLEGIIRQNYRLNSLEPDLMMKAVTTDGADIEFYLDHNILSSSAFDRRDGGKKAIVQSDSLSSIIENYDPDTIIMDVEGAEIDLLSQKQFGNVRNIIVEIHPHIVGQEAIQGMFSSLADSGFDISEQCGKTCHLERKRVS